MCAPLLGSDLPYFAREAAADVIFLFKSHDPHAALLRYPSRRPVWDRLRRSQGRELQFVEPIVGHDLDGFGHQAPSLPRQAEPEPSLVVFTPHEGDAPYELMRRALQPQGPMPLVATLHGRQSVIAAVGQGSIF